MQEDYNAILQADACRQHNDRIGTFLNIQKGLAYNYKNYELYYMLGEYYLEENPKKAYLCFENAEYYCNVNEDFFIISQAKKVSLNRAYLFQTYPSSYYHTIQNRKCNYVLTA